MIIAVEPAHNGTPSPRVGGGCAARRCWCAGGPPVGERWRSASERAASGAAAARVGIGDEHAAAAEPLVSFVMLGVGDGVS